MVISFAGVIVIASAKPIYSDPLESETNNKIIGTICSISVSICYAVISVLTR